MFNLIESLARVRGKSLSNLVRLAPQHVWTKLTKQTVCTYYWSQLHATPAAQTERRNAAIRYLRDAEDLLFLCHGNICRSPFAERYARKQLSARGINEISVASAGLVEMNDPRPPTTAQDTAETYDIDLTDHRSVKTTTEGIKAADLILTMDYRNYHNFTTRYPDAAQRIFLLRVFDSGPRMQIPDPHGYTQSVFESVYSDISTCIRTAMIEYKTEPVPGVSDGV